MNAEMHDIKQRLADTHTYIYKYKTSMRRKMLLSTLTLARVVLVAAVTGFELLSGASRLLNDLLFNLRPNGCLGRDSEPEVPFEIPEVVSTFLASLLFLGNVPEAFLLPESFPFLVFPRAFGCSSLFSS